MLNSLTLATISLAALVSGMPSNPEARFANNYVGYVGDGSTNNGWPSTAAWGSFDDMWNANYPLIQKACGYNGADNSPQEIQDIKNAILQVGGFSGLDQRLIMAIMMQESKGCSHNGSGSCEGQNPCPQHQIITMISDGVADTSTGAGLKSLLARAQGAVGDNARAWYVAARLYNSGSVDYGNLNNGLGSTPCYASDVANRLTGWTFGDKHCRA